MLKKVYGNECLSHTQVFEWFKWFKEGCETTEDDPRPGRPSMLKTDEPVEKIVRGYTSYRKDVEPDQRARGGVAIFLKEGIPSRPIPINTNLQVIAVEIDFPFRLSICNIYLPDYHWSKEDLTSVINHHIQLQSLFLLLGDFDAYSTLWGSLIIDRRGNIIEEIIEENDIVLLNTGEATRFHAATGDFSRIDLTLCTPRIAPSFNWKPLDQLHGSDHFPITISTGKKVVERRTPRKYIMNRANWTAYQDSVHIPPTIITNDLHSSVNDLTTAINEAAQNSIPISAGNPPKTPVPWWNTDVKRAMLNKKKAFNVFKRCPTQANLIEFKKDKSYSS
ncbi:hypothetical protein NQ318_009942 [Aromia moschata]|uniref:Endonuclease/exonuclease/phosphatase domain-containing protein n=1 Tax=Aromia moschata TaxID=1265417 RepID=A0AAV8XVU8_9CUCU|nr:hypothetical protein NQ318_009942 [Aromia moschata]